MKLSMILVFIALQCTGFLNLAKGAALAIDEAIRSGRVAVDVTGLGGSTGDVILVRVKKKQTEPLLLAVSPGTVFRHQGGNAQDMVALRLRGEMRGPTTFTPKREIYLADDAWRELVLEGYCLDFYKRDPTRSDSFDVDQIDTRTAAILMRADIGSVHRKVTQAAIWLDRTAPTRNQLQARFRVTETEYEEARALLADVPTTLQSLAIPRSTASESVISSNPLGANALTLAQVYQRIQDYRGTAIRFITVPGWQLTDFVSYYEPRGLAPFDHYVRVGSFILLHDPDLHSEATAEPQHYWVINLSEGGFISSNAKRVTKK